MPCITRCVPVGTRCPECAFHARFGTLVGMLLSGRRRGRIWGERSLQGVVLWLLVGELVCDLWGSAADTEIKESALNGP